jgi:hypothetical protein
MQAMATRYLRKGEVRGLHSMAPALFNPDPVAILVIPQSRLSKFQLNTRAQRNTAWLDKQLAHVANTVNTLPCGLYFRRFPRRSYR